MKSKYGFGLWVFLAIFSGMLLKSNNALAFLGIGDTAVVTDILAESSLAFIDASTAATAASAAATASSTDLTLLQQVEAYAQQVLQFEEQVIEVEMLIKDLGENPLEVIVPDANKLIANQQKIFKLAKEIDALAPNVGENMVRDIKYPKSIGLGQGSKFQLWSESRINAVQDTLDSVAEFRKAYLDDNKDIMTALKNIGKSNGKTAAIKAAAFAAGQQAKNAANMVVLMNEQRRNEALREAAALSADAEASATHQALIGDRDFKESDMPKDGDHKVVFGLHM